MVSVCGGRALLIYDGKLMEKGRIGLGGGGGGLGLTRGEIFEGLIMYHKFFNVTV